MTYDGRIEAQISITSSSIRAVTASDDVTYTIPVGTYYMSTLLAQIVSGLNTLAFHSPNWSFSLNTGASGDGQVRFGHSALTWSLQFIDTNLRTLFGILGGDPTLMSPGTVTGGAQACGVWVPDCTVTCETDPRRAPKFSDRRETMSANGDVRAIVGNFYYMHENVVWSNVDVSRTWEQSATLANASWEHFYDETQNGGGLSYFSVGSKVQIYAHTGLKFGIDANGQTGVSGWKITGTPNIAPKRATNTGWTGQWRIAIPALLSSG